MKQVNMKKFKVLSVIGILSGLILGASSINLIQCLALSLGTSLIMGRFI